MRSCLRFGHCFAGKLGRRRQKLHEISHLETMFPEVCHQTRVASCVEASPDDFDRGGSELHPFESDANVWHDPAALISRSSVKASFEVLDRNPLYLATTTVVCSSSSHPKQTDRPCFDKPVVR